MAGDIIHAAGVRFIFPSSAPKGAHRGAEGEAKTAYKDIFTMASRKAALEGQPSGLPASKMNSKQFAMLMALLEEYASNVPEQMAQAAWSR